MMKAKQRTPQPTRHAKVLVVEGEHDHQDLLRHNLTREGHTVVTAGTGLGLSIIKHIAITHGGRVTLKSLGQSRTFRSHSYTS